MYNFPRETAGVPYILYVYRLGNKNNYLNGRTPREQWPP